MPRLQSIEAPSSVAVQSTDACQRDQQMPTSSTSQSVPSRSKVKRLAAAERRKTAAAGGGKSCPGNAPKSTAKLSRRAGVAVSSQSASQSCRKQKWNALVRKSAPLTDTGVDEKVASGTQRPENKTAATTTSGSTSRSCRKAERRANNGCRSPASLPSSSRRHGVETEADTHDRVRRGESRDFRSTVSPSWSSSSSSSSTTSCSRFTSPSSSLSSLQKRPRLNSDCHSAAGTLTECGRCRHEDSVRSDRHHDRHRCCRAQHVCRRRCCSTDQRDRCHRPYDDDRRDFHDDKRYGTAAMSCCQPAPDRPPLIGTTPTDVFVFPRPGFNPPFYARQTPDMPCRSRTTVFDGTPPPIRQETSDDFFDPRLPTVGGRSCHLPPVSTSSSFAIHSNNAADPRSSSTLGDRFIPTPVESRPIPLEPVGGSMTTDPRPSRPQQLATDVDPLDITQPCKVRPKLSAKHGLPNCRNIALQLIAARCYAERSIAMASRLSVCLSVCPCVRPSFRDIELL